MRANAWKISTFTAIGVAAFLALHPVSKEAEKTGPNATKAHPFTTGNGFWSFLGGSSSSSDTSAPRTGTHLQTLRNARNSGEECEALRVLRTEAAGDEEAIGEIANHAGASYSRSTRICAISALEVIRTAAARSYLTDLLNDGDKYTRDWAMRALASKARDDADARATMITAAHSEDRDVRLAALVALGDAHVPEASALIQDAITHESGEMQARLINALGQTRDTSAVSAITKMLDNGSQTTRDAALEALGAIGGNAALTVLKDKLDNGTREEVDTAARALAATGDAAARQTLIDAAQNTTARHDEQIAALRALSQVDGEPVRGAMVKALHGSDSQAVSIATGWFSSHGDRAAIPELTALLKTAPSTSHGSIVSALSSIGGDEARDAIAAIARASGPDQVAALNNLVAMPGGREEGRRIALKVAKEGGQNAGSALALLGQDGSTEARDALVSLARAGGDTAPQAMNALTAHGDADAMRALGDLTRTAKTPQLRAQALTMLGSTQDPKNAPLLTAAARDKDASVRHAALYALGRLGGETAERALVDATRETDTVTRDTAIRSLGSLHSTTAKAELEKLASSSDNAAAVVAFQTLVIASPDRAAAVADRAMATGTTEMRQSIVQNASQFPTDTQKRILSSAIRDTDASVASSAVATLATIGGADAQQSLLDLLSSDATAALKRSAADALQRSGTDMSRQHSGLIDKYKSDTPDEADGDDQPDMDD